MTAITTVSTQLVYHTVLGTRVVRIVSIRSKWQMGKPGMLLIFSFRVL
jgi:hypothetical protein